MKHIKGWPIAGLIAAVIYVALSTIILAHPAEGSWSGFLVFLLGWPLTLPGLLLGHGSNMQLVICFGALQWFLLGGLAWSVTVRIARSIKPQHGA